MVIVKTIKGDLLESTDQYIAQQCNCCTVIAQGLSKTIADKWIWGDIYSRRSRIGNRNCAQKPDIPGTIEIIGDEHKYVICMFGQYGPGKPGKFSKYYPSDQYTDTYQDRKKYFQECLTEIENRGISHLAMPYLIGCGLAGGNWTDYASMLHNSSISITLYKL